MRYADIPLALKTERIVSVDALRGFSIFWILGADAAIWALDDMLRDKGPVVSAMGNFLGAQLSHAIVAHTSACDRLVRRTDQNAKISGTQPAITSAANTVAIVLRTIHECRYGSTALPGHD